jgi:hypothetical protein
MTLHISLTQLEQLNIAHDCEFVEGMAQYLAGRFRLDARPGFEYGSLASEIKPIVAQAGKLDLPRYDGYALHVLASFIIGVDYHEMPTVKPVLHSKELSGDLKALWLDRWFYSMEDAAVKQARR